MGIYPYNVRELQPGIILPLDCFACTGVYVGRDVSADGTVILAKSNDYQAVWPNHVTVTERKENAPGRSMPVDNGRTVFAPLPAATCRYTSTPWMDSTVAMNGQGYDATKPPLQPIPWWSTG